jgi:hypothetical protein
MNELESARKLIDALRGDKLLTLKDLATRAGFQSAASRDFKMGFSYLQKEGAVKLRQSGWRSEKRSGNNHPKTALLVADIYELDNTDREMCEETGDLDETGAIHGNIRPELIPVLTLSGGRTFVSKEEYDAVTKSKINGISFWKIRLVKKSNHK